jgi:hypothetical protein
MRQLRAGHTSATKFVALLADGRRVFAKSATSSWAVEQLVHECRFYSSAKASCAPDFYGCGGTPLTLVTADHSRARWPPPWRAGDIDGVLESLEVLHGMGVPDGLADARAPAGRVSGYWAEVAEAPAGLLSLGVCSSSWLELALPKLAAIDATNRFDGYALIHGDLRSDNMCEEEGRWVFVDWSYARAGCPELDFVLWLPSLVSELGYIPRVLRKYSESSLLVSFAGYLAANAGLPEPEGGDGQVRKVQRRQLHVALPLASSIVGVRPPF